MNNKNNAYLICNNNGFNYVIVSNMYFMVNDINPQAIEQVHFEKENGTLNIDDKVYIDIDDDHIDVLEECIKQNNVSLSILSIKGDILAMHDIV